MKKDLDERLGLNGLTGRFVPATEAELKRFEDALGVELPVDYREFLMAYGAAVFSEDVWFKPIEASPWSVDGHEGFDLFYGITENQSADVIAINTRIRNNLPPETIAIGHDPGNNKLLLSVRNGEVLFCDKETGKTYLVARTFAEFLDRFALR